MFFLIVYGIALALASLFVFYRDINQIWDVLLQMGFFLSPIVYPLSLIPEKYLYYYMLNPITRMIEMYRDVLYTESSPDSWILALYYFSG